MHLSIRTVPTLGRSGAKLESARHLAGAGNQRYRSRSLILKSEWNFTARRSGTITGRFRWFLHLRAKRSNPSRDRSRRSITDLGRRRLEKFGTQQRASLQSEVPSKD